MLMAKSEHHLRFAKSALALHQRVNGVFRQLKTVVFEDAIQRAMFCLHVDRQKRRFRYQYRNSLSSRLPDRSNAFRL